MSGPPQNPPPGAPPDPPPADPTSAAIATALRDLRSRLAERQTIDEQIARVLTRSVDLLHAAIAQRARTHREIVATLDALEGLLLADPASALDPLLPAQAPAAEQGADPAERVSMLLLVQRVPDAATAAALQRFVVALPPVRRVTSREFAANELRLQLQLSRPLTFADLAGWTGGALEPAHVLPDALVVRFLARPTL